VQLACALSTARVGRLLLQDKLLPGARAASSDVTAAKAKAPVTYGTASFTIVARDGKTVRVHLNAKGRRLLAKHLTAHVWANVRFAAGATAYAARIQLHR
jgi:hypothetical protein